MIDNRKLIIRKAKDGINHEAVVMDYCGSWYEKHVNSGYTPEDAIRALISSLQTEIFMLEEDLDKAMYGRWEAAK